MKNYPVFNRNMLYPCVLMGIFLFTGFAKLPTNSPDSLFEIRKLEIPVFDKNADGLYFKVTLEYELPVAPASIATPEDSSDVDDVPTCTDELGLWIQPTCVLAWP
ncbi:hypothetical protein [Flavihumibacter fluvii]|uniref:hypothetical protein n=1 Tax=Flavihumibacter fluvii TaxID=2838157 RepID=UPI001BDF6268|nr:hypothetical protein [Flavihumibacter fluvii]ULQ51989.1 hypothetical protein KJS93_18010 [Flavihumibacter fluvii]